MTTENELIISDDSLPLVEEKIISSKMSLAYQDLLDGCRKWRIWTMLAYQDILLRYRRSILGPFWLTISMAITVYSMGFLYGHLFHMELLHYYPYLVSSMLTWGLISQIIVEQTDAFPGSISLIKQIKLPYSVYIHRVVTRNIIIFAHNSLVMIPVYFIYSTTAEINLKTLLIFPSLFILYLNGYFFGIIFALIGSRYRDISQIIKSLVQVVFFMTPVMWKASILPEKYQVYLYFNPFNAFLDIVRQPILGTYPDPINILIVLSVTLIGAIFAFILFRKYRHRIIYWL